MLSSVDNNTRVFFFFLSWMMWHKRHLEQDSFTNCSLLALCQLHSRFCNVSFQKLRQKSSEIVAFPQVQASIFTFVTLHLSRFFRLHIHYLDYLWCFYSEPWELSSWARSKNIAAKVPVKTTCGCNWGLQSWSKPNFSSFEKVGQFSNKIWFIGVLEGNQRGKQVMFLNILTCWWMMNVVEYCFISSNIFSTKQMNMLI